MPPLSVQALLLSFAFYVLTINSIWLCATLFFLALVLIGRFKREE